MLANLDDLLEPIFELLTLFCQRLRDQLSDRDLERARALFALVASPEPDPRRFERTEVTGRVHLVPATGPIVIGTLHDLGAGGVQIRARRLPTPRTRALAQLVHPHGISRYAFPVEVAWTCGPGDSRAGLRFCGRPRRRDSTRTVQVRPLVPVRRHAASDHSAASESSYRTEHTG